MQQVTANAVEYTLVYQELTQLAILQQRPQVLLLDVGRS